MKRTLLILMTLLALITGAMAQSGERSYDNATVIVRYDGGSLGGNLDALNAYIDANCQDGLPVPEGCDFIDVVAESDPFFDEVFGYRQIRFRIYCVTLDGEGNEMREELPMYLEDYGYSVIDCITEYLNMGGEQGEIAEWFFNELGEYNQWPVTDPFFNEGRQPALNRANFPAAWASNATSNATVRIGVVDTGWENGTLFPFVPHEDLRNKVFAEVNWTGFLGINNALDIDYKSHGTRVAGLAAADTNNAIGVAGAGYDAQMVIFKTGHFSAGPLPPAPIGATWFGTVASIFFAHNFFGCQIITIQSNINIGVLPLPLQILSELVIRDATMGNLPGGSGLPPSLIIASSGNGIGITTLRWPAVHPMVMAVAGTNNLAGKFANGELREGLAFYSRNAPKCEVAASAQNLYSTENYNFLAQLLVPPAYDGDGSGYTLWPFAGFGGNFGPPLFGNGTSFAAPQVAGLAALVWDFAENSAPALNINPFSMADYVRARIGNNTDQIQSDGPRVISQGRRGRINAGRSVAYVASVNLPSTNVATSRLGTAFNAQVVLDRPAPVGGAVVRISSSNAGLVRPRVTSVRVAAGQTTATFGITVARAFNAPLTNNRQKVEIYADFRGTRQVGQLFVVR
ncbi:MAG TPA: S8 family serine peptidase [Fimbriimonadaceae bacterium]|nr:S8 family serine peptidase [Fimbriimonadaceae bacterium]